MLVTYRTKQQQYRLRVLQVRPVVGAYLEFVERKPLAEHASVPEHQLTEQQRRDGFEAQSADKIFQSTTLASGGVVSKP